MSLLRGAILAVAAALAVGFAVAALHRPHGSAPPRAGAEPVSVQLSLTPRDAQFGDTVVATTDVVADRPVRLSTDFAPYHVVSVSRRVRRANGLTRTHVEQRLRCLRPACVPAGSSATVRFEPLRVSYGGGSHALAWPALRVASRVGAADMRAARFRVPLPVAAVPAARTGTGWALLALAGTLAVGGAALLLWLWLPRRPARGPETPPLERALAEATAAAASDAGRRRRALDALARELEPLDAPLSAESRVLAWAPGDPRPDAIVELTSRVREEVAR